MIDIKRNRTVYSYIFLIFAALLIYWPVLRNQFLMLWDDQWVVINFYTESGLDHYNLWDVLTEFYHGQYAPVNEFYYIILHSIFGYDPFWFHLSSLIVHLINIILTYLFISKLLFYTKEFKEKSVQRISFLTALLLAIHPFLVESVAWISASKIILYAMFYLIALLMYLKYKASNKISYYLLTLLFFIISFGSKEQAVVMPLCLILVDYILKCDFRTKRVWLEKVPFLILALIFGFITIASQGPVETNNPFNYPFYQRIIFACYAFVEYLVKCLIPVNLSYIYLFPNSPNESVPTFFWMYPIIIIALAYLFGHYLKRRWIFFGLCFFIIHILVALHLISINRFTIVADRYVYLASIGCFFFIAYFIEQLIALRSKYTKFVTIIFFSYVVAISFYSHNRTKDWFNSKTLKTEISK